MFERVMKAAKKAKAAMVAGALGFVSSNAYAQAGLDHAEGVLNDVNTWVYGVFPVIGGIGMVVAGIAYFRGRMGQGLAFNVCIGCLIVGMGPGLVTFLTSLT